MAIEIVRSHLPPPFEKQVHHDRQQQDDVEHIIDYLTGASNISPDIAPFVYPYNPGFNPPKKNRNL